MNIPPPRAILDPTTARVELQLKHARPLIGCRFDPSGRFLFVSAEDDSVLRFDLLTGAKVSFVGHKSWVRGMAFITPNAALPPLDGGAWQKAQAAAQSLVGFGVAALPAPKAAPFTLVTADYHGKLVWWQGDTDTPKPLKTVDAHAGYARAVAVSPDGTLVASCGNDHLVKLWNAADGSPVRSLDGHTSHVYNVVFHPDGSYLVSCDLKGVVKIWDTKSGKCERELDAKLLYKYDPGFMADIGGARGIAMKADGSEFAVCGITNVSNAFAGVGNPLALVFDWDGAKPKQYKPKVAFQGTMWGVGFHPGGVVIGAGGGGQGRLWFWKGEEPTNVHTLTVPANCRDLALNADGSRFAIAASNGTAYVYDFNGTGAVAPPTPPKKK